MLQGQSRSFESRSCETEQSIEKSPCDKIIITTGTFAMPKIARYLELNKKEKRKTIVMTGSTMPLYGFPLSDAPFNLGYALSQVQILEDGVHICMDGRSFSSDEAIKAAKDGTFLSRLEPYYPARD